MHIVLGNYMVTHSKWRDHRMLKSILSTLLTASVVMIMVLPTQTQGQTGWLNPEGRTGVAYEWSVASYKKWDYLIYYKSPTSSMFLTGSAQISHCLQGTIELPMFFTNFDETSNPGYPVKEKHFGIANPYVGLELARPGTSPIGAFGLRLPVISNENMWRSLPVQFIEPHRFMAYVDKVTQISAAGGYRLVLPSGFGCRLTGGGQLGIPSHGDAELYTDVTTNIWYRTKDWRVMAAFNGLVWVTESGLDFGDRLLFAMSLSGDVSIGQLVPGFHLRIPLDKQTSEAVNMVFGIHIAYHFQE
jgi:hypothetical protein